MKNPIKYFIFFLLTFVVFGGLAHADCPFISSSVSPLISTSNGTSSAIYTVSVMNIAGTSQQVSVSAACDSSMLDCAFLDLPSPFVLQSGQTQLVHLQVTPLNSNNQTLYIPLTISGGNFASSCSNNDNLTLNVINNASVENSSVTATIVNPNIPSATEGANMQLQILVSNPTNQDAYVSILSGQQQGNPLYQSTSSNPSTFKLPAGQSQISTIWFGVPSSYPGGLIQFPLDVQVAYTDGALNDISVPVQLFVYAPRLFLQLTSSPASFTCVNAFAGNSTQLNFQITNWGDISGPFQVNFNSVQSVQQIMSLNNQLLGLNSGESSNVELNFTPNNQTIPGQYFYTLNVSYLNYPAILYSGCVNIQPVYGVVALSNQTYTVQRGISQNIPMVISNNGSVEQNYSISYNPNPINGLALNLDQQAFSLSAGQSITVNFNVQADGSVQLGLQSIPFYITSTNSSTEGNLNLFIVSDNQSGSSPLNIVAPSQTTAYNGISSQIPVIVENNGPNNIDSVQLLTNGFPTGFVNVLNGPQTIPAGQNRTYLVEFDIPAQINQPGPRNLQLSAISGLESVSSNMLVEITNAKPSISFTVNGINTSTSSNGQISSLNLQLEVINDGNVPASNITPLLTATGYAVNGIGQLDLQPGESGTLNVQVEPTANDPAENVFLMLKSQQGANEIKTVSLPALSVNTTSDNYTEQIIAILLLLLAIVALVKKDELEAMLSN